MSNTAWGKSKNRREMMTIWRIVLLGMENTQKCSGSKAWSCLAFPNIYSHYHNHGYIQCLDFAVEMLFSNNFNCVNLALMSWFCRRRKIECRAGTTMIRAVGFPPTHSDGTAYIQIVTCRRPQWVFLSKTLVLITETGNTCKAKQCCGKEHIIVQSRAEIWIPLKFSIIILKTFFILWRDV